MGGRIGSLPGGAVPTPPGPVPVRASADATRTGVGPTTGGPTNGGRTSGRSQRGSVTAEVAVVLPALVVLLAVLIGTAHIGTVQLRLEEAARAGAREVMRGESSASVEQTVQRLAGPDAVTRVVSVSGWTTVEVRARVEGPLVEVMNIRLRAAASGKEEHDG